ncbi:Inner centromere protein, partial [Phoenicopterus ruber ruber]
IKNFIKRNTPTRPDLKSELISLQEKERQRLESLRKKQEAEEQRRKKVEEEKRRRQAEMKQKALQARERVEQMEEEKKKRMEQKILQNDEKVRLSQAREEKVAEERSKKKLSKKHGEADARKQKALRVGYKGFRLQEEDDFEQQDPLQKRREDEVKEKGKRVLELKNLVEQQQVEQVKERYWLEEESPKELHQLPGQEKRAKQPESIAVASNPWLKAVKVSVGSGDRVDLDLSRDRTGRGEKSQATRSIDCCLWHMAQQNCKDRFSVCTDACVLPHSPNAQSPAELGLPSRFTLWSPKGNENNYGMDLNSDDSTDDENDPRKPVPAWADGSQLNQAILHQYYHPVNVDQLFGLIPVPKLEDIFGKSKPRYFKRTSSAVWHSPP